MTRARECAARAGRAALARRARAVDVTSASTAPLTSRASSRDVHTLCVVFHRLARRFATVIRARATVARDARARARARR